MGPQHHVCGKGIHRIQRSALHPMKCDQSHVCFLRSSSTSGERIDAGTCNIFHANSLLLVSHYSKLLNYLRTHLDAFLEGFPNVSSFPSCEWAKDKQSQGGQVALFGTHLQEPKRARKTNTPRKAQFRSSAIVSMLICRTTWSNAILKMIEIGNLGQFGDTRRSFKEK